MDYTSSDPKDTENNEKLDERVPDLPSLDHIPAVMRAYNQWVCWDYRTQENGIRTRVLTSESLMSLQNAYNRCESHHYGLGFFLHADDPFVAIRVLRGAYRGMNDSVMLTDLAKDIEDAAGTYAEFDLDINDLHIIGIADTIENSSSPHHGIEIWADSYILPITGNPYRLSIPSPMPSNAAFGNIQRAYCPVSWMTRVHGREGNEFEIFAEILDECLSTPGLRENARAMDTYEFLARCWQFPVLRPEIRQRAQKLERMTKDALEEFIDAILKTRDDLGLTTREKKAKEPREGAQEQDSGSQTALAEWMNALQYDARGQRVLENFYNMGLILANHEHWQGRIRFDEFRNRSVLDENPVSDETEYRIAEWLGREYEFGGNKRQILSDAIKSVASKSKYDALLEWIHALPDWDGVPRLENWMIDMCGAEDCDYSRWVARVTLLQMVNRALNPGCIARLVPIWNGEENQGKSTAIAMLGGEWATTLKISLENKEAHMAIHGYWIAELEELDTLYKTSEARLKAFLTNTSDHYVPKYANHSVDYPRRTVFIGTTNDSDYLRGLTGNTRFLPINTGSFDLDAIKSEREQLFAEARAWLLENPRVAWWEEPEALRSIIKEQRDSRRVFNVYEEDLSKFLDGNGGDNYYVQEGYKGLKIPKFKYLEKTTMSDILELYIKVDTKKNWSDTALQRQLREALKALGWYPKKRNSTNWWMRPEVSDDESVPF